MSVGGATAARTASLTRVVRHPHPLLAMQDLPSLNALRAFEAAARRGSVKGAAAELFVTPGAVSQQIKGLEQALGAPLFRRAPAGLQLTEAGAALYPVVREAFERIGGALARLRTRERAGPLTVTVLPSFAAKWLVPRLGAFYARHPQIDVRLSTTTHLTDLTRDDADVAIRMVREHYAQENPHLRCDLLFNQPLFPVCSPALTRAPRRLRVPQDLAAHTLLHDDSPVAWETWLARHGVTGVQAQRGPVFSDASMSLQAALEGQGVALARGELAARDLAEGRLVKPFDLILPYQFSYFLVCLPAVAEWPKVAAFREWMLEEVRRDQATPAPAPVGRPRRRRAP
jgi:LysR family glycine cleavage system transcriptional activator